MTKIHFFYHWEEISVFIIQYCYNKFFLILFTFKLNNKNGIKEISSTKKNRFFLCLPIISYLVSIEHGFAHATSSLDLEEVDNTRRFIKN